MHFMCFMPLHHFLDFPSMILEGGHLTPMNPLNPPPDLDDNLMYSKALTNRCPPSDFILAVDTSTGSNSTPPESSLY